MSTSRGRVTVKATCDICGREREAKPGVFRRIANRLTCSYHPFIPEEKLDATPYITFQARPIKDARPFDPRPTYQLGEEQIFSFLADFYRYASLNVSASLPAPSSASGVSPIITTPVPVTASAFAASQAALYFHALISEGQRPRSMVAAATRTLRTIADWLVANQEAGPGVVAGTGKLENDVIPNVAAQPQWGGYRADAYFQSTATAPKYFTLSSAAAGIALLRAYQLFGTQIYADAARACAFLVRNAQCGDLAAFNRSTSDAAGLSPMHWGAWSDYFQVSGSPGTYYEWSQTFSVQTLLCLQFLTIYLDVLGDESVGSSSSALVTSPSGAVVANCMSASRVALISKCIEEGADFWANAQPDATLGGTIKGFSVATPADGFSSFHVNFILPAGTGSWGWGSSLSTAGVSILSENWALGLSALYETEGASSRVLEIFDWLMTFTSNPANQLTGDDRRILSRTGGTYNPKFALAVLLQVRDAATHAFGVKQEATQSPSLYELSTAGLLAPLYSSRQQAAFKEFKDALEQPRFVSTQSSRTLYLGPLGRCGLSLQPRNTGTISVVPGAFAFVPKAAMAGRVYRHAPQAFLGRGNA